MIVEELDLSVRAYNCLKQAGIHTVEQLSEMDDDQLLRVRNISRKCVEEIRAKVSRPRKTTAVCGHWIEWWPPKHMILTGEEKLFRCSVCDAKYGDVDGFRFCPHCGKIMGVPVVNADLIRAKNDEELAIFIFHCMHRASKALCKEQVEDWLQQPVENISPEIYGAENISQKTLEEG